MYFLSRFPLSLFILPGVRLLQLNFSTYEIIHLTKCSFRFRSVFEQQNDAGHLICMLFSDLDANVCRLIVCMLLPIPPFRCYLAVLVVSHLVHREQTLQ